MTMIKGRSLEDVKSEDVNRYAWWTPAGCADEEAGVVDQVRIRVRIIDVRFRFGHVDYLVRPADGTGCKWVDSEVGIDFVTRA